MRKVSHGMKDAGGGYGFDRMTSVAATIEQAGKTGTASTIDTELAQLGAYLELVQVAFDRMRPS